MQAISVSDHTSVESAKREKPRSISITTTLYALIEAISEEVPEKEDALVMEVFLHLLQSGKIRFKGKPKFGSKIKYKRSTRK
jgi:hypothetical protein